MILKLIKRQFGKSAYIWATSILGGAGFNKPHILKNFENQIEDLTLSDNHGALITSNGELYTWGSNSHGQLGILDSKTNKPIKQTQTPQKVTYFEEKQIKIKKVVLGRKHTIALDDQGRLFSWGRGTLSTFKIMKLLYPSTLALGHAQAKNLSLPKPIKAFKDTKILQVSSGNDFAMALTEKNELFVWGRGEFGVLGFTNKEQRLPVKNILIEELSISTLKSPIKKIASCSDFSSVLFENGKIFSFGNNDQGNLGIGYSQSVDTCDVIQTPTELQFENQKFIQYDDFSLGEMSSAYLSKEGKIYFTGRKLVYRPKLLEMNYNENQVMDFCATDKGIAVLTKENKIFYNGNFWRGKNLTSDIETGIQEMDTKSNFDGQKVVKLGGQYSQKFVLVEQINQQQ